jgi:TonB family protein
MAPPIAVAPAATKPNPTAVPPPQAIPLQRSAASAVAARAQNSRSADPVYDASDTAVKLPVAISRPVPTWERPRSLNFRAFEGLLQIIVGEDGSVLESTMVKPMNPAYDYLLVTAAQKWRFQPATLGDRPVKYRMTYSFVVPPAGR